MSECVKCGRVMELRRLMCPKCREIDEREIDDMTDPTPSATDRERDGGNSQRRIDDLQATVRGLQAEVDRQVHKSASLQARLDDALARLASVEKERDEAALTRDRHWAQQRSKRSIPTLLTPATTPIADRLEAITHPLSSSPCEVSITGRELIEKVRTLELALAAREREAEAVERVIAYDGRQSVQRLPSGTWRVLRDYETHGLDCHDASTLAAACLAALATETPKDSNA